MPDRSISTERRLLAYNPRARVYLYLAVASGFIAALLVVAQAWLLSQVVSRVFIDDQTLDDVLPLLSLMLAFAFARAGVVLAGDVLAQRSASYLKSALRGDLTQHIFALGPSFTRGERSGELVNATVQGVEDLDEYVTMFQPLRFLAVLVPVFVALVVLAIEPLTVLILIVTGPLLVLFLALIGSRARALTDQRFLELSWMSASFLDTLQGLATLKMFGRSREQIETIRDVGRHYGKTTLEVLRTAFETSLVLEWSAAIATALVAVEISLRLMNGSVPFDRALAVLIITPEFFFPLRQLSARYHAGAAGKTAGARIFAILGTPPAPPASGTARNGRAVPSRIDIRLAHVGLSYENGQRPALRDVSLHIPHGRTVALVGATGAGKTSVANLLLRFVEPDHGSITIDGVPLAELDPSLWRSHVAWVPQRPHLFYGSIAENIRLASPNASDEDVAVAAVAAHAHDFIEKLPQGYDTQIGEHGARLSGGEQQRLAIARAFLKDAPFLILDEATSHLDAESERVLQAAIEQLLHGRTALIIAHRLTLAYAADHVVVLEDGRCVEAGTHATLLASGGAYGRLVAAYEAGAL